MFHLCKHKESCTKGKCFYHDELEQVMQMIMSNEPTIETAKKVDDILAKKLSPDYQGEDLLKMLVYLVSMAAIAAKKKLKHELNSPSPSKYAN